MPATDSATSSPPEKEHLPTDPGTEIDDMLSNLQKRFMSVSEEMVNRMDEMGRRLDELEENLRGGSVS